MRLLISLLALALLADARAERPDYTPDQPVQGVLRVCGTPALAPLLARWEAGFKHYHPGIAFTEDLKGSSTGIFGLAENVADVALMGRQMYTYESYGIYRRSLKLPVEVAVANGSVQTPKRSFALAVFVNAANPLHGLSMEQLDGIYGSQRSGGWQGLAWAASAARGPEKNLRTWGQLGLKGEWADKPIHVMGPPGLYPGGVSFFQSKVMGGGDTWAENLREFDDPREMAAALAKNPYAIAYGGLCYQLPGIRALPLSTEKSGGFVSLSKATIEDGTYPLARQVYVYFAPDLPSGELRSPRDNPKVREFLRYILSRQGQADVEADPDYLPLNAAAAEAEGKKLD